MRKLKLRSETLTDLTAADLVDVVGAALPVNGGPTLSLTCTSAVDACLTARGCTLSQAIC